MLYAFHLCVSQKKNDAPISKNLNKVAALENQILFEDDCLIILNKPSGIAVHGGSGLNFGVIEALRALRPEARFLELVHRLDRDTSGILLIAKKTFSITQFARTTSRQNCSKRLFSVSTWAMAIPYKSYSSPSFEK